MTESSDPSPVPATAAPTPAPPRAGHAGRVLVALLGFGTLVAAAVAVIASLLFLGGVLEGTF